MCDCHAVLVVGETLLFHELFRVLTTLENMEISGNFLILKSSGNLKYTLGIFVYQMLFFVTQSETLNKLTCKFVRLEWY